MCVCVCVCLFEYRFGLWRRRPHHLLANTANSSCVIQIISRYAVIRIQIIYAMYTINVFYLKLHPQLPHLQRLLNHTRKRYRAVVQWVCWCHQKCKWKMHCPHSNPICYWPIRVCLAFIISSRVSLGKSLSLKLKKKIFFWNFLHVHVNRKTNAQHNCLVRFLFGNRFQTNTERNASLKNQKEIVRKRRRRRRSHRKTKEFANIRKLFVDELQILVYISTIYSFICIWLKYEYSPLRNLKIAIIISLNRKNAQVLHTAATKTQRSTKLFSFLVCISIWLPNC